LPTGLPAVALRRHGRQEIISKNKETFELTSAKDMARTHLNN